MACGSPFPLLHLPQENLKCVLQKMRILEQICISLLSKKTMDSAREFCGFNRFSFQITVSDEIELKVGNTGILNIKCTFDDGSVVITNPSFYDSRIVFFSSQFNSKNWLKQLLYIFDSSKIDGMQFFRFDEEFQRTQFHVLKDSLTGMKIVNLCIRYAKQMLRSADVINAFLPIDRLTLEETQPLNSSQLMTLSQAMSQNIEKINLSMDLPLNNLLLTSCSDIGICRQMLTDKEINMFLKHWISGLKPELENFCICRHGPAFNRDIILKGIPYNIASLDRKIKFRDYSREVHAGGIDIYLGQENIATLVFFEYAFTFDINIAALHVVVHNSKYITLE
ncbi:F-box associated domain-containing protein [Caenorhabditis elegans]|uniref:F-box associated domain-containing protein n=1 Tax=Caenorhabditis elegans TaxID=6239 RepID=O44864_CAEEL|nr:F-box associated domain-containing protein [Caenorhabditis elegans]CCD72673.2 F-box associated domain-containing protein [Caenorhabditis elegans]|eukprot:NP_493994.2 F-box B protein [Caenorhabditis elegans]